MDASITILSIISGAFVLLIIVSIVKSCLNKNDELADRLAARRVWDHNLVWPTNETEAKEIAERNMGILMQTMRQLGCQPEKEQDQEYVFHATYQGETFSFYCAHPYVRIYDPAWGCISVDDPLYPDLCEAMNKVNCCGGPTVVMSDKNEDGDRYLYSHITFLLHPQFPDTADFMRGQLDSFFSIKNEMDKAFHQQANERQQPAGPADPLGSQPVPAPTNND